MKTYRGKIVMSCIRKKCIKVKKNIKPDCIDCEDVKVEIVDLKDNVRKTRKAKKRS